MPESTQVEDAIRTAVAAELGFTIHRGFMDGTFDRDTGCVFVQGRDEAENVDMETIDIRIRLWGASKRGAGGRGRGQHQAIDNAFLEDWIERVYRALEPVLSSTAGETWFGRPTGTVFDHGARGVEIMIRVFGPNHYRWNAG